MYILHVSLVLNNVQNGTFTLFSEFTWGKQHISSPPSPSMSDTKYAFYEAKSNIKYLHFGFSLSFL